MFLHGEEGVGTGGQLRRK